jgi:hypothetical protein
MPGMENLAPDRTETSRGLSFDPSFRPLTFSRCATAFSNCFLTWEERRARLSKYCRHADVDTVKPGGTGRPALVISARPAPLPPSKSFMAPWPSALPSPKK